MLGLLRRAGFNITATISASQYDALAPASWQIDEVAPGAHSALIAGHAGPTLWPRFQASPEARSRPDPLDRYSRRVFGEAAQRSDPRAVVAMYADRRDGAYLPLVGLAERAGLGHVGRFGLLMHADLGPWLALRGVIFLPQSLDAGDEAPARGPHPCDDCAAPCVQACPAILAGDRMDAMSCVRAKIIDRICRSGCRARDSCIVGRQHRYPLKQLAYHSRIHWRPALLPLAAWALLPPSARDVGRRLVRRLRLQRQSRRRP